MICSGSNMSVKCLSHEIEYLSKLMEYLKNFISFSHQQEKLSSDKQEMTFNPFLLVGNFRSFNWIHSRTLRPPLSCSLLENLPAGSTYGQAQLILPSQKSSLRTHLVENLADKSRWSTSQCKCSILTCTAGRDYLGWRRISEDKREFLYFDI